MKKIFTFLLILSIFMGQNCAFANRKNLSLDEIVQTESTITHNVLVDKQKKKNGYRYAIIDNETKKPITPYCYEKIIPLGMDTVATYAYGKWKIMTNSGWPLLHGKWFEQVYLVKKDKNKPATLTNSIFIGSTGSNEYYISTPGYETSRFFKEMFEQNNQTSWIKFHNYPTTGIIIFKSKNKYGYIKVEPDCFKLTMPIYDAIEVPDKDSAIYKQFGITYADINDIRAKIYGKWDSINSSPYWIKTQGNRICEIMPYYITEEIQTDGNNLNITYKSIKKHEYMSLYMNDKIKIKDKNSKTLINDILNQSELYKFHDFPSDGILITKKLKKKGLIVCNKDGNKIIPNIYDDFYFQDSNSTVYKLFGISYSNPNKIWAKKDNKWGMIDSNNNVVQNFDYDRIILLPAKENIIKNNSDYFTYISTEFPNKDMILAIKNNKYGLINSNGDTLINFKERYKQENITNIIKNKNPEAYETSIIWVDKNFKKYKREEKIGNIMTSNIEAFHFTFIFMPAIIVASIFPIIIFYAAAASSDGRRHPIIDFLYAF